MSTGSKSVSFEEYRKKNWRNYNNDYEEDHDSNGYSSSRNFHPGRASRNQYEGANSFYEISQLHIPPPLEPQDRLVRCVDPSFGRINGSSYIMPSSLTQASQAIHSGRHFALIPPPSAYRRDENSRANVGKYYHNPSYSFNNEDDGNSCRPEPSACDIIEIKRPGTVCIRKNDSDCGLAYHYNSVPHRGGGDCEGISSCTSIESNFQTSEQQQRSHFRSSNGLFNLPEVYSPPPLSPAHQNSISALTTNPAQLHCLMPSFFVDPGIPKEPQRHQYGLQQNTPRLAYSEPILKPEVTNKLCAQRNGRPENAKLSPRMRNKTFIIQSPRKSTREEKRSYFPEVVNSVSEDSSGFCGNNRHHEYNKEHNETADGESNCHHNKHDGRGDYSESALATKSTKLPTHNCLSPRAKLNRLQPSVITPAVTESLLCECLDNLKSAHWEDNFEAFSQIYNLTELHPGRVKSILNKVIWHGLPHLSSPRTKLARMACICFKRLFQTQKRSMETEGEKVFYRLLDLCGGLANNFIQQESREALIAAVEFMDPLKSLSFLELHGAKHKNPHVREFSAYLLSAIMDELPQNKLMNKEFSPRIIPMIVSFLREGLLQTRLHAKLALDKIFDHPTFESKLRRYVSPENVRHISDTLREFRERRSGHI